MFFLCLKGSFIWNLNTQFKDMWVGMSVPEIELDKKILYVLTILASFGLDLFSTSGEIFFSLAVGDMTAAGGGCDKTAAGGGGCASGNVGGGWLSTAPPTTGGAAVGGGWFKKEGTKTGAFTFGTNEGASTFN